MSNKPNPVVLTSAMLATLVARIRSHPVLDRMAIPGMCHPHVSDHTATISCARMASDLHRIAPACQRHAVARLNGEWRDGQRGAIYRELEKTDKVTRERGQTALRDLEASIDTYGKRLDKRIEKLNQALEPLAIRACRGGDPRGCVLRLTSTNPSSPLPGYDGEWPIGR